jgi:hypothetical protein
MTSSMTLTTMTSSFQNKTIFLLIFLHRNSIVFYLFLNKVPYFFYFRLKLFLVEMADEFEKLVNECTILSTEIIHNLERISSSQKQEEIENSNVEASRKLVKFKEVTELIENILVPGKTFYKYKQNKNFCSVLFVKNFSLFVFIPPSLKSPQFPEDAICFPES